MATSRDAYNKMQSIYKTIESYKPINQDDIYRDLVARRGGFQPLYDEAANREAQAYAAPAQMMNDYISQGLNRPGQGASSAQKLASMMGTLGRYYGMGQSVRDSITGLKGRTEDLARTIGQTYEGQREDLWRKYAAQQSLFNTLKSSEDAAAARAQAALNIPDWRQYTNTGNQPVKTGTGWGPGTQYGTLQEYMRARGSGTPAPQKQVVPIGNAGNGMVRFSDGSVRQGYLRGSQFIPGAPKTGIAGFFSNLFK